MLQERSGMVSERTVFLQEIGICTVIWADTKKRLKHIRKIWKTRNICCVLAMSAWRKGKLLQARYYYRKSLQCDPERSYQRYTDCADRLFHHFGDNDGAMCLLKKAEEMNGRFCLEDLGRPAHPKPDAAGPGSNIWKNVRARRQDVPGRPWI